jgi:pyruvate dehydrogenase E1 component alpha subunit
LKAAGVRDAVLTSIEQEAKAEMLAALEEAKAAPWPAPEIAYDDVQDVGAEKMEHAPWLS